MDLAWEECGCNHSLGEKELMRFYSHPVWLLNGLFIEQHQESLGHRHSFTSFVAQLEPKRVADFGGGFGALARMLGTRCGQIKVEVIEPHPHPLAIELAKETANVRYVAELNGEYDVIMATDVFEHVRDPIALVEKTSQHLVLGGHYLMANCFLPVIRCHLPENYHWHWSWPLAMQQMNLQPGPVVAYGRIYQKVGPVAAAAARLVEQRSRKWCRRIENLPKLIQVLLARPLVWGIERCLTSKGNER